MTREEAARVIESHAKHGFGTGLFGLPEAFTMAVAALREPAHEWVRTADRLPEPWVTVLLWNGDEKVSGYADDDGDLIEHRWGQVFRATHWMLPEPPGEEVEE